MLSDKNSIDLRQLIYSANRVLELVEHAERNLEKSKGLQPGHSSKTPFQTTCEEVSKKQILDARDEFDKLMMFILQELDTSFTVKETQ